MSELAPGYKPTTIGHEIFPEELGRHMLASSFVGLEVLTDSLALHMQLDLIEAHASVPSNEPLSSLCYTTDTPLPFHNVTGELVKPPSAMHPGDVYTGTDLQEFFFRGNNKLGTLVSMAYGIRAFGQIQVSQLGLHSSLIFDQETEDATLIVGRNHAGKSTIGQALEDADERFLMVADDWSEVNLESGIVTPVSTIFSPPFLNENYTPAFTSFGKNFYYKRMPHPLPSLLLSRVVELHDGGETVEPNSFILRSLTHIPFIRQSVGKDSLGCDCLDHANAAETITAHKTAILCHAPIKLDTLSRPRRYNVNQ